MSLTVKEALEEGPVVCTVTLKNVSKDRLRYGIGLGDPGAYCRINLNWKRRLEPSRAFTFFGNPGPYRRELYPDQSVSETFYLHKRYLSVPGGEVAVHFGWRVYQIVEKHDGRDSDGRKLDLLFELKGNQTLKVLPATEGNVASTLQRLEGRFPEIAKSVEHDPDHEYGGFGNPAADLVGTLDGCRHKEFVPLLLRAIDILPGENYRQRLIGTVYESFATPEEGFSALADHLAAPSSAADEVFDFWKTEDRDHLESEGRQDEIKKLLKEESDPEKTRLQQLLRAVYQSDEDAWKQSKRHLDTRLTKEQFARLRAEKDVWVRTLLYSYYPDHCPNDWVDALFNDLKRTLQPPDRFGALMARLDDEDFEIRERATAELIESGPRFAWHLWAVPRDKLSPEAAWRLGRVLGKVKEPEFPALWRRTIAHLGWHPEPQNRKLLDVLRTNDCPGLISRAAQQAFEDCRKWHEEHAARERERKKQLEEK